MNVDHALVCLCMLPDKEQQRGYIKDGANLEKKHMKEKKHNQKLNVATFMFGEWYQISHPSLKKNIQFDDTQSCKQTVAFY